MKDEPEDGEEVVFPADAAFEIMHPFIDGFLQGEHINYYLRRVAEIGISWNLLDPVEVCPDYAAVRQDAFDMRNGPG